MNAVELLGVTRRFGDVVAVAELDLEVHDGEFLSLLGPSGCGKTTTLRLIAGFERPDAGEVRIAGKDVARLPPYRRPVNTVFQSYALFPHLSVLDNVAYGLKQRRAPRAERRTRARELLELVRLPGVEHRRTARALRRPAAASRARPGTRVGAKVLLLDEPLGALDLKVRKELQIELKRIQLSVGITFVYVTHDQEEALAMLDRVAVMSGGRIEQLGRPQEIYDKPATAFVAGFIGETNFIESRGRTVAIRPEGLRVEREGEGLRGQVLATMVIGPAVQSVVRLDDGQEVLVREQRRRGDEGALALAEGEQVKVSWADIEALEFKGGDR